MKNSAQLSADLKVFTSNLENYFLYNPSLSLSPCKGTIHEVSIKNEGEGIWKVTLVKSRSNIPKNEPAQFEGYINFLDKSKQRKNSMWLSYNNMKEMTRYFVVRVAQEELENDIKSHKPLMDNVRKRNLSVKTPSAKNNKTLMSFLE